MRRLLLALVALSLLEVPLMIRADEAAPVTNPAVVKQHYQQVLQQPQFQDSDEDMTDLGLRDWLSRWITQLVTRFQNFKYAGQMSGLAWAFMITITLLAIGGLIYLITKLSRRKRYDEDEASETGRGGVLLSPRAYEEKLQRALETRDWHAAWLAVWLQFLALLERRQLVEPDRSRTNREYLAQLRESHMPASALPLLGGLVDDYDHFVYGMRPIDEPVWHAFHQRIEELTLLLHLRDGTGISTAKEVPA